MRETLRLLDGRRYTAAQVMRATGINSHTLTNYLSKSDILLCSESPGQGRARQFCLIDVYQLGMLRLLSAVTGNVAWSTRALDYLLFVDAELAEVARTWPKISISDTYFNQVRDRFCMSVFDAPEPYHHRDANDPIMITADYYVFLLDKATLDWSKRSEAICHLGDFTGGLMWNMTAQLIQFDQALARELNLGTNNA